jgi:hypothetical protein
MPDARSLTPDPSPEGRAEIRRANGCSIYAKLNRDDAIALVIVSVARTPMGGFQGELKGFAAPELGAAAIRAAVERAKLKPEQVEEVIMGCVLPAGQGQAPARQAALGAGLPLSPAAPRSTRCAARA